MTISNLPARHDSALMPSTSEWSLMRDMAASLIPTGFLPEAIKKPEQAVAIMLKGRELGVPPMYALSNIVIVKGKPTVSAEMMLALIYRDHGKQAIRVKESTNDHCTIEYRLTGWDVTAYTFTIQDAEKAGLATSNTWRQYPAAMLRARCISAVARMAFPESIAGMYVPGELGDDVVVDSDGVITSAPVVTIDAEPEREPRNVRQLPEPPAENPVTVLREVAAEHDILPESLADWAYDKYEAQSLDDAPPRAIVALIAALQNEKERARFVETYPPVGVIDGQVS